MYALDCYVPQCRAEHFVAIDFGVILLICLINCHWACAECSGGHASPITNPPRHTIGQGSQLEQTEHIARAGRRATDQRSHPSTRLLPRHYTIASTHLYVMKYSLTYLELWYEVVSLQEFVADIFESVSLTGLIDRKHIKRPVIQVLCRKEKTRKLTNHVTEWWLLPVTYLHHQTKIDHETLLLN